MTATLKRALCLVIFLGMALMLLPAYTPVSAAEGTENLRATITQQYDTYAASLNKAGINEAAIRQLLNHAITGNGSHLVLGENDSLTGSMFNSNTFRALMVDTLTCGAELMQGEVLTRCLIGTNSLGIHDFACDYKVSLFEYNDTTSTLDDVAAGTLMEMVQYTGGINANDKAMMLVVGGARFRIRMIRMQINPDEITYHIQVYVQDTFSFDSDYSYAESMGYDTSLSDLINTVGKLLDHGLLDTYDWECSADFVLTVPNACDHKAGNYRWEYNGTDLVSVAGDGITENTLTRIQTEKNDGTLNNPYYQAANTVFLWHDKPWVLEFRMKGSSGFIMSPGKTYSASDKPYLLKTAEHYLGGEYFRYTQIDAETGNEVTKGGRKQYGIQFTNHGYTSNKLHTYRLENRVSADGSNMVYLLIDGEEIGPMVHYFLNLTHVNEDQNEQVNWFCGKDFAINYIFNANFGFASSIVMEYVQIWELGESTSNETYFEDTVVHPSCAQSGYTNHTCKLCGATYKTDETPALEHTYEDSLIASPTCTEQGYTTHTCTICGYSCTSDHVPALGHSFGEYVGNNDATCVTDSTATAHCRTCGAADTVSLPGTALGHAWREADCITVKTCTACGMTEGSPLGHSFGDWYTAVEATCSAKGQERRDCANCDHYETVEVDMLPHTYRSMVVEPTCAEKGYTIHTCSECGHSYLDNFVDFLGHHYSAVGTPPTCTENGYTTYICDNCGNSYIDHYTEPTGHRFRCEVQQAPTVDTHGILTAICSRCSHTEEKVLPVLGERDYTYTVAKEPTEKEDGLAVYTWKVVDYGPVVIEITLDRLTTLGDVNGDGEIDILDANLVVAWYNEVRELEDDQLLAADVNGDGEVDIMDANMIVAYYNEVIDSFPTNR